MNKVKLMILLEQMEQNSVSANSSQSTLLRAHRKAEKLNAPALLPILREIIENSNTKEKQEIRKNAYFIIASLLKKTMRSVYCQYLVDRLGIENDKYVLSSMLDGIAQLHIPNDVDLSLLIECTRSDQWLVRHSAINALSASNSECSREAARYWVAQSDEKTYKYEIIYANAVLGSIGDSKDINILERHIDSDIVDVKESALYAIKSIVARNNKNS